jgi:hypothetical protein
MQTIIRLLLTLAGSDKKETKEETSGETLNSGSVKQAVLALLYQKIKDPKMTPSKALRQTQLSFIKQNKDSTLWAPYVMVGGKLQ